MSVESSGVKVDNTRSLKSTYFKLQQSEERTMPSLNRVISKEEELCYATVGFGGPGGFGHSPALLVIDVQYSTAGISRKSYWETIKEYPMSFGDVGWDAVNNIVPLWTVFWAKGFPFLYPHAAPKNATTDDGRLAQKIPSIMGIDAKGYEFVDDIALGMGDLLLPKKHPSVFFGAPLISYLIDLCVDMLFVIGCTTSGRVRSSVTDAFALNFKVIVPEGCVYDHAPTFHVVNLWDMKGKYADIMPSTHVVEFRSGLEIAS
jgi:maleamate amidohydrolase